MSNNDLKDNQMSRGLTQALYKYLPNSWIDFYKKVDRTAYTAYVKNWRSGHLRDVNHRRLLLKVSQNVEEFQEKGNVKEFVFPINEENYDVRTPEPGLNVDVITEISPLTFFCGSCFKVHSYNSSDNFYRLNPHRKCMECGHSIKQLNLVYACECGWGGPIEQIPCKNRAHGYKHLYYTGKFSFYCSHEPNRKIEIFKMCPSCNKRLYTKNALDMGNYIPFNLTMIDLVDTKLDDFLINNNDGAKTIISYWLEKINRQQLDKIVKNNASKVTDEEKEDKINELTKMYVNQFNMPIEQARMVALATVGSESNNNELQHALDYLSHSLIKLDIKSLNESALQILEYDTVLYPPNNSVSTLQNAMEVSRKLNTNASPEKYESIAKKYGFKHTQASGYIPFIMCSYGFTRKETDPGVATLVGFPAEIKTKKNVYASKLNTEGILFEMDRVSIINWLLRNKIIDPIIDNVPEDLSDESEVKSWFINKIDSKAIKTFSNIDINENKITYYVYNLIHSVSHALLRQAANMCGLDKNSLSEYIFPNIPGFLIYCQNSQGINIGALFNLFEAYFDKWLQSTKDAVDRCIFDPICIDRDHSCSGCLYLNEVSCVHFNKDLDRRLLIGWYDKTTGDRLYGFWED